MIKAIIFDYYGVLTTDEYFSWLQRNPEILQSHTAQIEQLGQDQDEGLSDDIFFARLADIAGRPAQVIREEFDIHDVSHGALINYIRHLRRKGYHTAILSNSDVGLYDEVKQHHLSHLFELILCSAEAGVTKPHPQIFKLALERLGVTADEAIFTDDRQYNVDGATAVGITGLLYTGLPDFRAELSRRGIDTQSA